MAPAQTATPTTAQTSPSAAASATIRVANGDAASEETSTMQTAPAAETPAADLASTVSYLKTLDTDLKAQTAALNGDTTTNKTAYYKPVNGRTLYW
ncbi:Uncharacterised protein, partial [Mycoplasmopsis synoviae]